MSSPAPTEVVQWSGPEALNGLLVPIAQLHEDPANINEHDEESIRRIAASYARFGQQKPLVADDKGVVRAGNGQLRAALRLGWTHLAISRSNLTGTDLAAYALADNRTAEFSRRDDVKLAEFLRAVQSEPDYPIEATGYEAQEVDALLDRLAADQAGTSDIDLGYDGEHGDGFAEGQAVDVKWLVKIPLEESMANDDGFKTALARFCGGYGLEFSLKATGG